MLTKSWHFYVWGKRYDTDYNIVFYSINTKQNKREHKSAHDKKLRDLKTVFFLVSLFSTKKKHAAQLPIDRTQEPNRRRRSATVRACQKFTRYRKNRAVVGHMRQQKDLRQPTPP